MVAPKACSGGGGSGGGRGGGGSSGGEHGGGCGGGSGGGVTNTYLQCGGVLKRGSLDHTFFLATLSAKVGVEEPLSGKHLPSPMHAELPVLHAKGPST